MVKVQYYLIPLLVLLIMIGPSVNRSVLGHTFSGDESASFLTKAEMVKIESQLAEEQLSNNVTLAKDHAEHLSEHITANDTEEISERNSRLATELNNALTDFSNAFETGTPSQPEITDKVTNITDIIAEVVNARIDEEQLNNVTVKALVINDLLGETLEHYGIALGNTEEEHESKHVENMTSSSDSTDNKNNESPNIVDNASYQSAQAAVLRALEIFTEMKQDSNTNSTELGDSLNTLKEKIDNKAPVDEIDTIVDENLTPLLNSIFKLNLVEEGEHAEEEGGEQGENESNT